MNKLQNRRWALMGIANGGNGVKITSYTTTDESFNVNFNTAAVPLISQNEVLIWNIRGTNAQGKGSVGGKFGLVVVQNGAVVSNSNTYKRMSAVIAPDSSSPSSEVFQAFSASISNGCYQTNVGPTFYVGIGNTIDFVQIPYNIGWNV